MFHTWLDYFFLNESLPASVYYIRLFVGRLDSWVVFTLDYNEHRYAAPWAVRSILGLVANILFWLKHNIYARKNFQRRRSGKEAERTIINTIIC